VALDGVRAGIDAQLEIQGSLNSFGDDVLADATRGMNPRMKGSNAVPVPCLMHQGHINFYDLGTDLPSQIQGIESRPNIINGNFAAQAAQGAQQANGGFLIKDRSRF